MKAAMKDCVKVTLASQDSSDDSMNQFFGGEVRYLAAMLSKPHRQDGQDFSFAVVPYKLTEAFTLEQSGPGVLCQTKEEADESLENLDKRTRRHLVSVQWPGNGRMAWVSNFRRYFTEIEVLFKNLADGKKLWVAIERETDHDTLEVKVLRRKETDSEGEARFCANQWREECELKKKVHFDSVNKCVTPTPPPRCTPLTKSDVQDLANAKMIALKKQWPCCFKIFERQKSNPTTKIPDQEVEDAYQLDLVANGSDPFLKTAKEGKIRADMQLISSLHKAAKNYANRGKSKILDTAIYLIAFKWELGWCYLSDEELAQKLGEILETKFTSGQVKHFRYRTLGLVAKHSSGSPPKSP
jgi:hypothetical protein